MLNYGFSDLRLVKPKCDHLSDNARSLAVGSYEVLENARVYDDFESCIADIDYLLATTGRGRRINQSVYSADEAASKVVSLISSPIDRNHMIPKVGVMFGREKNGLSNDEILHANAIITIDTFGPFPVLNLAQSVNVICYEMYKIYRSQHDRNLRENTKPPQDLANRGDLSIAMRRLENILMKTKYYSSALKNNNNKEEIEKLSDDEKRYFVFRGLRQLWYGLQNVTKRDISIVHGVLQAIEQGRNASDVINDRKK